MIFDAFPKSIASQLRDIEREESVQVAMQRARDFSSPVAAFLSGVAADPEVRKQFEYIINQYVPSPSFDEGGEVIIGGGVHAAIWASTRRRMGAPKPGVLDARSSLGGVFGWSCERAFYLNSRNRASSDPGVPGTDGELNKVINGPVQPSDLNAAEYQTNRELSFAVLSALGMHALVRRNSYVKSLEDLPGFKRIVIATGIGQPKKLPSDSFRDGQAFVDFRRFMYRYPSLQWPLRGIKRVAIVGGGDSARVAIEFLVGQGPSQGKTVASIDRVERIDWFGAPYESREIMEELERSRYKQIARFMRCQSDNRAYVIQPYRTKRVTRVFKDSNKIGVFYSQYGSREEYGKGDYDLVINCTGFTNKVDELIDGASTEPVVSPCGESLGRKVVGKEIYIVGPAAELPFSSAEAEEVPIDLSAANKVALWRYGRKTAKLAIMLGR